MLLNLINSFLLQGCRVFQADENGIRLIHFIGDAGNVGEIV